ncbi:calpain-A-like [Styela clava]
MKRSLKSEKSETAHSEIRKTTAEMGNTRSLNWVDIDFPPETQYTTILETIKEKNKESDELHLFKDTEFPTNQSSLFHIPDTVKYDCITSWKRPHELSADPEFENRYHVQKINVGPFTSWYTWTGAIAALSTSPACLVKTIKPRKQTLNGEEYVGMFIFHFWELGSWTDVIIDDYLPMIGNDLAFSRVDKKDPYWLPLMQKAYAKHCGTYQAAGGLLSEFFEDFTGGLAITYRLNSETGNEVFTALQKAKNNSSFVCCTKEFPSVEIDSMDYIEQHGFNVIKAIEIENEGSTLRLIEVMTPHQKKPDWTGDWSVESKKFKESEHLHEKMGYHSMPDGRLERQLCGVFTMSFEDFKEYFMDVTILATGKNFQKEAESNFYGGQDNWLHCDVKSTWKPGSIPDLDYDNIEDDDVCQYNPHYYMELKEPDDFNPYYDAPTLKSKCFLLMELMQKDIWRTAAAQNEIDDEPYLLFICLHVFKVNEKPTSRLPADFFRENKAVINTRAHCDSRQVSFATALDPGHYVVVPSVYYDTKEECPYLLRVYAERQLQLELL